MHGPSFDAERLVDRRRTVVLTPYVLGARRPEGTGHANV
jgi:hypothetical protein